MYPDLLAEYGVDLRDVIAGKGPAPLSVLSMIARLPLGSAFVSMQLAERSGGEWRDYLGKTHEWFAMADVYDAIMLNTRATGQYKKNKAPKFDPYPRPGRKSKGEGKKAADSGDTDTITRLFLGFQGKAG